MTTLYTSNSYLCYSGLIKKEIIGKMKDFVNCAREACNGKLVCQEELSQPNWIRFMLGLPLKKEDSIDNSETEETDDGEDGFEAELEEFKNSTSDDDATNLNKSIIKDFLSKWINGNKDEKVIPVIRKVLKKNGELQNFEVNHVLPFKFFEQFIVNYSLIDCNIKVLLNYRGNKEMSWSSYFLKYISTIIEYEFCPVIIEWGRVNKSTFTYRATPDETILLFSKKAKITCIKDEILQLKLNNKIVASLSPKAGLSFKCSKELFKSNEPQELKMVINNFQTVSNKSAYAYECQNGQFIASELFKGCKNLIKVELSDKIKVIESDCFADCDGVKKLEVPYECFIEGEYSYYFNIISRKPPKKNGPSEETGFEQNKKNTSFDDDFKSTPDVNEKDTNCIEDDQLDNTGLDGSDDNDRSYIEQLSDIKEHIESALQRTVYDDVLWCLKIMPNKLHSEILSCTFWGLPKHIKDVKYDKNGNVKISSVGIYLKKIHPECENTNWYSEKNHAINELHKVYIVYTTWSDWKSLYKGKIQETLGTLKRNGVNDDNLMVLGRLLSGKTFAEIAKKMKLNEDDLRTPGITHAFNLLYELM